MGGTCLRKEKGRKENTGCLLGLFTIRAGKSLRYGGLNAA